MTDLPTGLLCLPSDTDNTVPRLRHKVRLVALKALLTANPGGLPSRMGLSLSTVQRVIQSMVRTDKAVVLAAIGAPDVLNPLLVLAVGMRPPAEVLRSAIPALMASLQPNARAVPEAILWEAEVHDVPQVHLGRTLRFSPPAKALLLDASGLEVECHDGTRIPLDGQVQHPSLQVEDAFFTLGGGGVGLHLSLHDGNPLSMDEAHPDKEGNAVSLGGRSAAEWVERLDEALDLVALALPEWHREVSASLSRIVPVGFEPEMHLSASYREGPELIYMTLHPDPLTMAEAIIHETQHSKCNLLSWMDPVLDNAYTAWTESPVRPDLRPLMGVLLAVHAFVPVSALHQRLIEIDHPLSRTRRFAERRAEVLAGNAGGLAVVRAQGKPTQAGARVIAALSALHEHLAAGQSTVDWDEEALPPA